MRWSWVPPGMTCGKPRTGSERPPEEDSLFSLPGRQPVLEREQRRAAPGSHPDLGIEILDVIVGGLRRDAQRLGDLLDRLPAGNQPEHLDLAWRQPGDLGVAHGRDAMAGR